MSRRSRSCFAGLSASRLTPSTGYISAPPASTKSNGTAADSPPSIASTTPVTFADSPACGAGSVGQRHCGRGRAEGVEKLVAEGAHLLERSGATGHQPVLPPPRRNLPEHGRVAGDDRDRQL